MYNIGIYTEKDHSFATFLFTNIIIYTVYLQQLYLVLLKHFFLKVIHSLWRAKSGRF